MPERFRRRTSPGERDRAARQRAERSHTPEHRNEGLHPRPGNQAVQSVLRHARASASLPELDVSRPDDATEVEARWIARTMDAPAVGGSGRAASPVVESGVSPDSGQPLDPSQRAYFERRLGYDLGHVRVHHGRDAAAAADALDASAFALGSHIVFGSGWYLHGTRKGARLLAHELAHVIQQTSPGPANADGQPASPVPISQRAAPHVAREKRVADMQDYQDPRQPMPRPPRAAYMVFEEAFAWHPDTAHLAFRDFALLSQKHKRLAFEISYKSGNLQRSIEALGSVAAADEKYAASVQELLRWIEEAETVKAFGLNEEAMVEKQAGFLEADPGKATTPGWGGTRKTRWKALLPKAREEWKKRGEAAIKKMAAYAQAEAPELNVTEASFELEFDKIDRASLGAIATSGSKPGKTLYVGFEFIAVVEIDPAYALSTIVHELYGHPSYDAPDDMTYGGVLHQKAAKLAKKKGVKVKDPSGHESFNYYQSEIYSLLKEIPYWTQVAQSHAGQPLDVAGTTRTPEAIDFDPRGPIEHWLTEIRDRWEPSVGAALLAGFHKRIKLDPTISADALSEFEKQVRQVFGEAAKEILAEQRSR